MKRLYLNQLLIYLLALQVVMLPGCKKENIGPDPGPGGKSELLVSSLSVALVVDGQQTVNVKAVDKHGEEESFTVTSDHPGIAAVSKVGPAFKVSGVALGSTRIVVKGNSGKKKEIPVVIYDQYELETNELYITFAQEFEWRAYNNWPSQATFFHPVTENGFYALGSIVLKGAHSNIDGKRAVMVVKAKEGSDALAHPVSYIKRHQGGFGTCWQPVPPAGYKAMGMVVLESFSNIQPSLTDVVCIREDLVVPGTSGDGTENLIWAYQYGSSISFVSWRIEIPDTGPHEYAYLSPGTFLAEGRLYSGPGDLIPPGVHPVMNVLKVSLPMLAETPYESYVPRLEGYNPPPSETVPIMAREMLVPCTIVKDPFFDDEFMWRVENSPFYRLERQVYYKLLYHNHNQTSVLQHNSYTKRYGVTTTESEEFSSETGISVTVEAGIGIGIFTGKIAATVSTSMGYATMTSISELEENEYESGIDVLPGKAVAIWQRWNRLVLKRHNGTELETVKSWDFGINSFVTDEYPDATL